jgi:hypothetical protein
MGFLRFIIKVVFIDTLLFILNLLDYIPELFLSKKEEEKREKRRQVFVSVFFFLKFWNFMILNYKRQRYLIQKIYQVLIELVNFHNH